MAKGETLKATLEELRNSIPELKGVLLASNEGLPIAHALTNGTDPNRLAAMAAAAPTQMRGGDKPTNAAGPSGATAMCKDGSYSHSTHHSGTCSGHHGVATWY